MKRTALVTILLAATIGHVSSQPAPAALTPPALPPALAKTLDPVIDALWTRFSRRTAMAHVQFVSQFWRLSGNVGYDATINRIRRRLIEAGFRDKNAPALPSADADAAAAPDRPTSTVWVDEYPNAGKGWNYSIGTLAIVHKGAPDEVVLSRDKQNLSLCINSFSTVAGGVTAPLVDVGRGRETDFAAKDVKGAVVLGDADAGSLSQAALAHGAIGVISTSLGSYVNPNPPSTGPGQASAATAIPRDQWNILQWGSIRYDEAKRSFGFKSTPHAASTLRKALAAGPVTVRVTIASTFSDRPNRMLIAEIPGRSLPNERVVVTAHVQEPGANDNASGVATLAELARAMRLAIRAGAIPPPERTLTFLWLEEISGSRQWLTAHADEAKNVRYMFSMDMTGEDVRKTGGSFLIERWPDPGAVWDRPWDPHSEWGGSNVRENQVKGDLINDLHFAICARVAAKTGWIVKTNPYEGGSDHSEFGRAGIPAVLDWHFTDRYYHTNYDTADKTSPSEMRNVGVSVAASAWLLASADEQTSLQVATLVANAGQARLAIEEREGQKLAAASTDPAAARVREATIVQAWRKWYDEAIHSVSRLVAGPASPAFAKSLDELATRVRPPGLAEVPNPARSVSPPRFASKPSSPLESDAPDGVPQARQGQRGQSRGAVAATSELESLLLAADRLQADRAYPQPSSPDAAASADQNTLKNALTSSSPEVRGAAVRAIGRFESALDVPKLLPFLSDPDATVRRAAAAALAQSLKQTRGDKVLPVKIALEHAIAATSTPRRKLTAAESLARAAELEALARLRYDHQTAMEVAPELAGAPDLLAILLRQDRLARVGIDAVQTLQRMANPANALGDADVDVSEIAFPRLQIAKAALEALYLMNAVDVDLATTALHYHCAETPACGWELRYVASDQLDVKSAALAGELDTLRHDPSLSVRLSALRKLATTIPTTQTCRPLVDAVSDLNETVVVKLEAIRLMDPRCNERDEISTLLVSLANGLDKPASATKWQLPARAFEMLVKFRASDARRVLDGTAMAHPVWQVRAAAARVAAGLKDDGPLVKLAADADPNVRAEALAALGQLKSPSTTRAAVAALSRDDHQVVRAAALALKGCTEPQLAAPALFGALTRLTKKAADNSRDARVAIIDRFKEFARGDVPGMALLPYVTVADLQPFLKDYDPAVATAIADVIATATGVRPDPAPIRRAPQQPRSLRLSLLDRIAVVTFENGDVMSMRLMPDDAPLAVARFIELASRGYYNGLTFHRIVPLFVVQGGSPGANEYVGDERFLRDEIGFGRNTRGAVGLSTRGRDTGDAQFYIDLTDQPRLDYDYTIFARVTPDSMPVVDAMVEGAQIKSVTIH